MIGVTSSRDMSVYFVLEEAKMQVDLELNSQSNSVALLDNATLRFSYLIY